MFKYKRFILLPVFILVILEFSAVKSEFGIKEGDVPSYIFYNFQNISDEILSKKITINISLSRIEGTLLYIVDKRENQLIITLYEELGERMKIEFRGQEYFVKLFTLCGCEKCRYKPLVFDLEINEHVSIKCNSGNTKKWKINDEKHVNKEYPMDRKEMMMWLVNTPLGDGYYPNNVQLHGCIHEVSFNGQTLNMQIHGEAVKKSCNTTCRKNICNFGICYETYNEKPFCDCSDSFKNGPYCKSDGVLLENHSLKSVNQNFQFRIVKVRWSSNSTKIFHFYNERVDISATVEDFKLVFKYENHIGLNYNTKCVVTDNYTFYSNSILTLTFELDSIIVQYSVENRTIIGRTPTMLDLSQIFFSSMELFNGNGMIDVIYKTDLFQYHWINIDIGITRNIEKKGIFIKRNHKSRVNNWKGIGYKFQLERIYKPKINYSLNFINTRDLETNFKLLNNWKDVVILVESLFLVMLVILLVALVICRIKNKPQEITSDHVISFKDKSGQDSLDVSEKLINEADQSENDSKH